MTKKINVYGTQACPYCHMAKDFLEKKGVEFNYFDVGEDENARNEMVEKSGQMGVPVIIVDDEVIVGFNETRIKELLKIE